MNLEQCPCSSLQGLRLTHRAKKRGCSMLRGQEGSIFFDLQALDVERLPANGNGDEFDASQFESIDVKDLDETPPAADSCMIGATSSNQSARPPGSDVLFKCSGHAAWVANARKNEEHAFLVDASEALLKHADSGGNSVRSATAGNNAGEAPEPICLSRNDEMLSPEQILDTARFAGSSLPSETQEELRDALAAVLLRYATPAQ